MIFFSVSSMLTPVRAIGIDLAPRRTGKKDLEIRRQEFHELMISLGNVTVMQELQFRRDPEYHTFLPAKVIEDLLIAVQEFKVNTLVLNNIVKPQQIFALGELLRPHGVTVWDRIDLILEIFTRHAGSAEAKLQIELARVRHMGPRIFGMGMELSRQGGGKGAGPRRGVGETNTEIMKRHLKEQERRIFEKLAKVTRSKDLQRKQRRKENLKTVALVGYTNAGKSSVMQLLTKKENIAVNNAFFVTLDTRLGRLFLPTVQRSVLLADTIGFIAELPPDLISAFTSTLSEALHADLLLQIVDLSDPAWRKKVAVVDKILQNLHLENTPQVFVGNKIDLLPIRFGKTKIQKEYREKTPVFISAVTKTGIEELKRTIAEQIFLKRQ